MEQQVWKCQHGHIGIPCFASKGRRCLVVPISGPASCTLICVVIVLHSSIAIRPLTRRCHIPCIPQQHPALHIQLAKVGILPLLLPALLLLVADLPVDRARLRVDDDAVAVVDKRERSAEARLGDDMPDDEATRCAGEAAVGDEGGLARIGCEWSGS